MSVPSEPIIYRRPLTLSNSVELYWYPPLNNGGNVITSYIIESANIPYINILPSTDRKSIITNLTTGNTYYFTIKATNVNGNGNIASFHYVIPGFKPLHPSNINITNDLSNVYFSFNNPLDIGNSSLTYNTVTFNPLDMYGNMSNIPAFTYNQSSYGSNIIDPLNTKFLNSSFSYQCFIQSINTVNDSEKNYFDPYINTKIPTNGLKLWLDPYDRSTLTISNNIVTKLIDKSGNKSNAFIIPPFGPSYDSSNCLLNFNGSQYLTLPDNTIPSGNSSYSIFMYVSTSNISRNGQWFLYSGTPTSNLSLGGLINSNLLIHSWFGNQQTSNSNISANISYLVEYTYDSGVRRSFLNGSLVGLENIGSRNSTVSNNLIATNSNLTANLVGSIGDIIIYNRILSNTERNSVKGYLERKKNNISLQNVGNLVSWLDATDSDFIYNSNLESKIDYGSKVFTWLDRSRANNNATQSNVSVLPTRRPYIQNNLDVLEFNQSYLTIPTAYYPIDAFIVLKLANIADLNGIIGISPNSNNYSSLSDISGSRWAIDATSNSVVASTTETSSNFLLMEWSIGNNNNYIRRYGSNIANVTTGTWTLPNNSNIIIGNANGFDLTKRFKGYIGEIIMFNKQLEDGDRYPIEGYLAWKWGLQTQLPSDHPYKNSAPYLFYKYLTISSNTTPITSNFFSPANIGGLQLWLDATDTTKLTISGSNVTAWTDKSTNAYVFNSVTTNYPTLNSINSVQAINFVGSGTRYSNTQRMYNANATFTNSNYTVYIVAKQNVTADSWTNYNYAIGVSPDYRLFVGGLSGNYVTFNGTGTTWNDWTTNNPTSSIKNASLLGLTYSSNTLTPYFNGTTMSSKTGGTDSFTGVYLGDTVDGFTGQCLNGQIGEIVVYNQTVSSYNRQRIEGYLAWKWGLQSSLPSTHLFKNSAPTTDFHPLSISGALLWLDANDSSTLTLSSTRVTQWSDKSGNSKNATNSNNNTTNPTYNSGDKSINFNGTQYLDLSSFINAGASNITIAIIWKVTQTTGTNFQAIIEQNSKTIGSAYRLMVYGNPFGGRSENFYGLNGYGTNPTAVTSFPGYTTNSSMLSVINAGLNSTTFNINNRHNGSLYGTQTIAQSSFNIQTASGRIGMRVGETVEGFYGNIQEIIVYSSSLNDIQSQQLEGYLAWKWGLQSNLPTTHPFKTFAPTAVFAPSYISSLGLWLDAADTSKLTLSGSNVTGWIDKSTQGYTATNIGTVTTSTLNGKNIINMSNNRMQILNFAWRSKFTVFMVIKSTNSKFLLSQGNPNYTYYIYTGNWGLAYVIPFECYDSVASVGSAVASANTWFIFTIGYNNTTTATPYRVNGTTRTTTTSVSSSSDRISTDTLYFNGSYNTSFDSGTNVAEILIYNDNLSNTSVDMVEGYLAWKWGLQSNLPSNHPYKNAAP